MKNAFLGCMFLILTACGGDEKQSSSNTSGNQSTNIPRVEGYYVCVSNCVDVCIYDEVVATQTGTRIVAVTSFGSCTGNINSDGDYSADCENNNGSSGHCDGTFAGGLFTSRCTIDGVTCQQAVFEIQ